MLESILRVSHRAKVFRFASYQDDGEFMRQLGWDRRSRDEMMELLRSCGGNDSVEQLCDAPFKPRHRVDGGSFRRTRFSDGSFAVFYCAIEAETARAEAYHWFCKLGGGAGGRRGWYRCFTCEFDGTIKDLTERTAEWQELTHDTDYEFCNAVGAEATREGLDGLLAPSVRKSGGTNLPVFERAAISKPEVLEPVEFVSGAGSDGR